MTQRAEQPLELREYLAILRARRWTIVLAAVLVLVAAMYLSFRQTPLYEARTRLLLQGIPTDATGTVPGVNVDTESQLVGSEPVAARVAEDVGRNLSTEELLSNVAIVPVSQRGAVLEITYISPDPEAARDVANSFGENYIEFKRTQAEEAIQAGTAQITDQIELTRKRLEEVTRQLEEARAQANASLVPVLETERSVLIARLGVLQQRLDDFTARQPADLGGGEVIEPASLPVSPTEPDHVRNGLLALFLGLALGVGLAFLRERLDDRFRGLPDASRTLGSPVLATVPRLKVERQDRYVLAVDADPKGHASESYKSLRTGIEFLASRDGIKSFLITSPSTAEGKTMTTANLALSLAQAGSRVIVVSSDMRRPQIERYFDVQTDVGLSKWLSSADTPWPPLYDPGIPNLRVIPTGEIPSNPAELLASPRVAELVTNLEQNSDLVLFDSPPVLPVADPLILASRVDAVVLVVDAQKTHRSAAVHAKNELERVGGKLRGIVLNSFDPSTSPYYYYGGYYYYRYSEATGNGGGTKAKLRSLLGLRR